MKSDLQDFVAETLIQIVRGIAKAQEQVKQDGAIVNPRLVQKAVGRLRDGVKEDLFGTGYRLDKENLQNAGILETQNGGIADIVEFDVAVTTTAVESVGTQTVAKGDAGVRIKVVSAGVDLTSTRTNAKEATDGQVSRLKFKIPVTFPQGSV